MSLLIPLNDAFAVDALIFSAGPVRGHGWSIAAIELRLGTGGDPASIELEAEGIRLPGVLKVIEQLTARCAPVEMTDQALRCRSGELGIRMNAGAPTFSITPFELSYGATGIELEVAKLVLGGGVVAIAFKGSGEAFSLDIDASGVAVADLLKLVDLGAAGLDLAAQSGSAAARVRWRDSAEAGEVAVSLSLKQLAFSDGTGLNAGENVALASTLSAKRGRNSWRFELQTSFDKGQVYLHPVFLDSGAGALEFSARGTAPRDLERIEVEQFAFEHQGLGAAGGSATLIEIDGKRRLDRLELETRQLSLADFHAVYVKPWFVDTVFSKVSMTGTLAAKLRWSRPGVSEAWLKLSGVDLEDGAGRFGLEHLNGDAHWLSEGEPKPTQIGFDRAQVYLIDIGAAKISGALSGSSFRLSAPLELPLLGGALRVDAFEASGLGGGSLDWRLRGALKPISLELLSRRLNWPSFSGSLSGDIPSLRYFNGEVVVDGKLAVRAFDGRVELDQLKLVQPFGVLPRLTADVSVDGLSLGELTSTFSFGKIEGRLSGRIDDLVLENWRPAAFDAAFATPKNDRSRHRISQRAVENLARLGGTSAALSSTLLKFLESFSYDRLGISCRLENGVCRMGGVEDAQRGYYIVKGGGLPPRIDVFGFNTLVDWSTLVERLKTITRVEEAVIR